MMARRLAAIAVLMLVPVLTAHIGSPDVFFQGRAGPYDVRVVVRPPEVVPGIARVTVRTGAEVQRVFIRPVFWRTGSKGAPSADEARRLATGAADGTHTFAGSLWLMARGAYSVDVAVEGTLGTARVAVPVASVATGRLEMSAGLGVLLVALATVLVAGLLTIVYKAAGEALLDASQPLDAARRGRARRAVAITLPVLALGLFGGARWWGAVDRDYERSMYRPSPLHLELRGDTLRLQATDTLWQPPRQPSALVPDHGKLMHLFLVRDGDASGFAHLHPQPEDSTASPPFRVQVPPLPAGRYHVFADVVHETGFERTLVGALDLPAGAGANALVRLDPDDAWHAGPATRDTVTQLADGSHMHLQLATPAPVTAGADATVRVAVTDASGQPVKLEPYMGMPAHAVVARRDGQVYVHLHPMGTVTVAAQEAFLARDRGDTTASGRLRAATVHAGHAASAGRPEEHVVEFPYAFPRAGSYRVFVQVKRNGRVLTGAFAVAVAEAVATR